MWDLVGGGRQDSVVLRDVGVRVGFVLGDTIDKLMVWLERFPGDIPNLRRNSRRKQESLPFLW
jgi:hypothetical protein